MIHRKGFESFPEKAACMNLPEKKKSETDGRVQVSD